MAQRGIRETWREFKPLIIVGWIFAAARLAAEILVQSDETMIVGVYIPIAALLVFCGLTGFYAGLTWKRLLLGCVLLGVLCWGLPNAISYPLAQFQGWDFGRYHYDDAFQEAREAAAAEGAADPEAVAEARLGRGDRTRSPPPGTTAAGKIGRGLQVALLTTIAGTIWSAIIASVCVGVPNTLRRRRGAAALATGTAGRP